MSYCQKIQIHICVNICALQCQLRYPLLCLSPEMISRPWESESYFREQLVLIL